MVRGKGRAYDVEGYHGRHSVISAYFNSKPGNVERICTAQHGADQEARHTAAAGKYIVVNPLAKKVGYSTCEPSNIVYFRG